MGSNELYFRSQKSRRRNPPRMLVPEEFNDADGSGAFITRGERGYWELDRRIQYYKVQYDESAYTDDAFAHYGVTFPSSMIRGVRKRRAEYLAGRICCSRILRHAGVLGEVLSQFPSRAPVWPAQIHGSISHAKNYALAVICPPDAGFVGVDIEHMDATSLMESAEVIAPDADNLSPLQVLINFSAKESLFKALYPQLEFYFGFECATVHEIEDSKREASGIIFGDITLHLTRSLSSALHDRKIWKGEYSFDIENLLITTLVVDPAPNPMPATAPDEISDPLPVKP